MNALNFRCPAAVHICREVLAHLEEWQALRCDLDVGSRFRIPPLVSFVAANLECAKATYLDPLAQAQALLHAAKDRADEILGLGPAHLRPHSDSFNKVISGHDVNPV